MVKCNGCNEYKEISELVKDRSRPKGHIGKCKPCFAKRSQEYKRKNPGKVKKSTDKFRNKMIGAIKRSFNGARCRSRDNRLAFNLDVNYLCGLMYAQKGLCSISKERMVPNSNRTSPSLDRIDPKLGYTKGNVQWLTWRMNSIKSDLNMKQLTNLCKQVVESSETIRKEYTSNDVEARKDTDFVSMI